MSHLSECNKSHLERICQLPPQTYRSSSAHTMRSDTQDAAITTSRGSVPRCTQSRKQMHQPCPPAPEQHWGHTWHLLAPHLGSMCCLCFLYLDLNITCFTV